MRNDAKDGDEKRQSPRVFKDVGGKRSLQRAKLKYPKFCTKKASIFSAVQFSNLQVGLRQIDVEVLSQLWTLSEKMQQVRGDMFLNPLWEIR